jgi:hypothetical protein
MFLTIYIDQTHKPIEKTGGGLTPLTVEDGGLGRREQLM